MAISLTQSQIDLAHTKYETKWQEDWQQSNSLITPYMDAIPDAKGNYMRFPRIGGTKVKEYTSNSQTIQFSTLSFGNYGFKPRKFYNAIQLNDDDNLETYDLDMNMGIIHRQQEKAKNRFFDMVALGIMEDASAKGGVRVVTTSDSINGGGILGPSYEGDNGETAHALDLSYAHFIAGYGNLIGIDYATTGTGVSELLAGTIVDRIKYGVRKLAENEAFDSQSKDELCFLMSPAVAQVLQSLEMSINKDYHIGDLGEIGRPVYNAALGCTVIQTNMLPFMDTVDKQGNEIEDCRMCALYLKSQVGFGRWKNPEFHIKEINDKVAIDYYLRVRGHIGAGRRRDDAVFVLPVKEFDLSNSDPENGGSGGEGNGGSGVQG